jgi:pimeloyl-ACP methyl ester carboxylesterase
MLLSTRRTARAAAALTALAVLAACGGGSDPVPDAAVSPTPSEPVATVEPTPTEEPGALAEDPATDPRYAEFYSQKLSWTPCDGGFQCTEVTVPIDWDDPDGKTIDLAVNRMKAAGPGKRIGSLILNPGGPGASGVEYLTAIVDRFGPGIRARYDLVGFDPRGVGNSAPLDCLTDRQLDRALAVDPTPDDAADVAEAIKQAKALAAGCAKRSGELLAHVDTVSVARDVDLLRAVLGDKKLHWLGYSYGTYIGATYARLFPTRIGRMVLDAVVDPALTGEEILLGQSKGFELAFSAFVKDCLRKRPCELGNSDGEIRTRLTALLKRVDSRPLGTRSGRELNEAMATLGLLAGMYAEFRWSVLRSALVAAYGGDGSGLLELADEYTRREPDGSYADNSAESIYAVNCLDHPGPSAEADVRRILPDLTAASPLFGEFIAWGILPCHYWPVSSDAKPGPVNAPGAPPILVIGTTNDPATPYEWSVNLAEQLESGVMLTRVGDGHTAYGSGNRCIDKAVETYLVDGDPPEDGKKC